MTDTAPAGPLHVATGGDEGYVPGILVLAGSMWRHNPGARVTVLGMGLSAASTDLVRQLALAVGGEVEILAVEETAFDGLVVKREHLSPATFLRLEIPRLLPGCDRVIYLDSDMVVTGSLAPLWEMDLGDALVAAVPDQLTHPTELRVLGLAAGEYANAGLLVMNLPLWRAEGIAETCRSHLADLNRLTVYADQSAVNLVCRGRVVMLPASWNFWSRHHRVYSLPEMASPPMVVHFIGGRKPWRYSGIPVEALWLAEAEALPVKLPPLQRVSLKKPRLHALKRAENWLRQRVYAALGIGNYREQYLRTKVDTERLRQWEARFILPHVAAIRASNRAQPPTGQTPEADRQPRPASPAGI